MQHRRLSFLARPGVMLLGMALATWPVWRWYTLRTFDGSDEPWGLLALLTVAAIILRDRFSARRWQDDRQFVWPGVFLAIYLLTFRLCSPLPRAALALAAFGALRLRGRGVAGGWGLLALSLPVVASAQFYVGFPLRILAAEASVLALRVLGFAVTRDGSLLHWRGEAILVDAPCSGVRMLWFGLYLACALAAWHRLRAGRTLWVVAASLALVIAANFARATALFFKETRIVTLPDWTHAAIGAVIFLAAASMIVRLSKERKGMPCRV